jgi:HEAT repeat protein
LDSYRLGKWEDEGDKVTNDDGKLIISSGVTQTCTKVIPDTFLKFLLHIARIPLKEEVNSSSGNDTIEGHQNNNTHNVTMEGHRRIHSEPNATAKAASQRAYEILGLIQTSYDAISVGQEQMQLLSDDSRTDATMSFFAACAGGSNSMVDIDEMTEKMKLNASDEKADSEYIDRELSVKSSGSKLLPPPPPSPLISSLTSSSTTTASLSASSVFSNVLSKMITKKQQPSFTDIKNLVGGVGAISGSTGQLSSPSSSPNKDSQPKRRGDYEVLINHEMLGLTVENVLERTIIRTLLPDGAARHAGAQVGSLVAKVGNIDTANLTHFETIDELRRSQRPLKLTLRHVGGDVLRKARDEMGRLIRGNRLVTTPTGIGGDNNNNNNNNNNGMDDRPWSRGGGNSKQHQSNETFDSVLSIRWPTKPSRSNTISLGAGGMHHPPLVSTRDESIQLASKSLIRILALLVVGLVKELSCLDDDTDSMIVDIVEGSTGSRRRKELNEALEITSKILLDFVVGIPDADGDTSRSTSAGGGSTNNSGKNDPASSFYPAPPGRVQSKRRGSVPPSIAIAGRGGSKAQQQRGIKNSASSPLLRIGDALKRARSFLVEYSSVTATILRWEIIDYLCLVLDLDTEQELSDNDNDASVTNNGGDAGSPLTDLGAAGSILKLIILNCSTNEGATIEGSDNMEQLSADTPQTDGPNSISGNCFLSVVHRLAASKSTSARVSACSLGTVLWSHIDFPRQLQLRGVLTRALHDVEVMVRKSTAVVLHEIAELVSDRRAVPWLVLMCERSMTDPEPQLRAAAMTLTWHLADHLPNAFLGDKDSRSVRRLPPRDSPTFMDVYLLQCKLFPVANNLAEDRIASVRLSVAAQCDKLCTALGEHWSSVIIDLLQTLLSDADELVRSEAILCMPRLVESVILGTSDSQRSITVLESLLPLALKIQNDTSSMVRSSLAIASGELLIFLVGLEGATSCPVEAPPSPGRGGIYTEHKQYVDETLIPILQKLLQDSDPEVVTASLRAVTNASRSGTAREAIARTRSGSQSFTDDDLVSLSSHQSLHSHTSYERTKPVFIPVLSEKQVLRLLPTLSNLGTSKEWRVRQSAVEIVPALMGCTHEQETRHEISKLCLRLMNDKVDSVRKTAAECFCLGGSSLARHGEEDGGEYVNTIVIPYLRTCSSSEDFKQRLLSLKMTEIIIINGLCPTSRPGTEAEISISGRDDESISDSVSSNLTGVSESEKPVRIILSIAATLISDKVPNVRLNVGRTFGAVMTFLDRSDIEFAVETLEKQLDDETARPGGGDRDVIAFAHQAISVAQPLRRMISSNMSNESMTGADT